MSLRTSPAGPKPALTPAAAPGLRAWEELRWRGPEPARPSSLRTRDYSRQDPSLAPSEAGDRVVFGPEGKEPS